jgi:hypothetical protein
MCASDRDELLKAGEDVSEIAVAEATLAADRQL